MLSKYSYNSFILLLAAVFAIGACNQSGPAGEGASPPEYDLNHPTLVKLSDRLNEISGLAYYGKDSSLFAIVDEAGVLYKLFQSDENIENHHWRFSKSADYEDIVLKDSVFYVMKSKGDIVAFSFLSPDSISAKEYNIPISGKNEFESLYYDDTLNKIMLICKDCESDDKTKLSIWAFDPVARTYTLAPFAIDPSPALADQKVKEKRFKPSAAAIHPVTGELYIISSVNKILAIADRTGKIKRTYPLDPRLYKQPEGITFTPSGDMFISNEAAGGGLPELLYYKYKNAGHEK